MACVIDFIPTVSQLHEASEAIGKGYRQYEYRKAYDGVKAERLRAVLSIQAAWRAYQTSVSASAVVFVRLAEEGAKCRRLARVKQRTAGLQVSTRRPPLCNHH